MLHQKLRYALFISVTMVAVTSHCSIVKSMLGAYKQLFLKEAVYDGRALCFTAEEANSKISMQAVGSAPAVSLETSIDSGKNWTPFVIGDTTITLTNVGDFVYFRAGKGGTGGDGANLSMSTGIDSYNQFNIITGKVSASGDISSLLVRKGMVNDLMGRDYCFNHLFYHCTGLTSTPALPATRLARNCYRFMFTGCTSLTSAPELPAKTLESYCYYSMFNGCTSLTSAPELPAKMLANYCYFYMFTNCRLIRFTPVLPASTLSNYCYRSMFHGCTSLEQVRVNFTDWIPSDATLDWLLDIPQPTESTPRFFECPEGLDTETNRDSSHVPVGWTVRTFNIGQRPNPKGLGL